MSAGTLSVVKTAFGLVGVNICSDNYYDAIGFARDQGVRVLEAYPVDKAGRSHDDFIFFGSRSLYERAGFREVVRRSPTRVVMRRALRPRHGAGRPSAETVTPAAVAGAGENVRARRRSSAVRSGDGR